MPELVRDATIVGPGQYEIDLKTPDSRVWVTIKANNSRSQNSIAEAICDYLAEWPGFSTHDEAVSDLNR